MKKIWTEENGTFWLGRQPVKQHEKLDNSVYSLEVCQAGFYLEKIDNCFEFSHKIYGLEEKLIKRVVKTYEATHANLGILLNGTKGTGKTVTAKIMCNELKQPTIIVSKHMEGAQYFLNNIPQNITLFFDEYEKVFGKESNMLSIMDGALNSEHKRVFLLTTNTLHVNENLLQRPGRVRYCKTFTDLSAQVIEEIINDILKFKEHKEETIKFISSLELITVDIVKAIVEEVNVHNEPPTVFKDVFNVKKLEGKYNIFVLDKKNKFTLQTQDATIHPRFTTGMVDFEGEALFVNEIFLGTVVEMIDLNTVKTLVVNQKNGRKKEATYRIEHADRRHRNYKYTGTTF